MSSKSKHPKQKLIDKYYSAPVTIDLFIATLVLVIFSSLSLLFNINVKLPDHIWEITLNLGILGIAIAGISLTVHTLLTTLRVSSNEMIQRIEVKSDPDDFENDIYKFFKKIYPKTIRLLLGCIIELGIVVMAVFLMMLFKKYLFEYLFFWLVSALTMISGMSLFRCIHVFSLVTNLFGSHPDE